MATSKGPGKNISLPPFYHAAAYASTLSQLLLKSHSEKQPEYHQQVDHYGVSQGGMIRELPGESCEPFPSNDGEMTQTLMRTITVDEVPNHMDDEPVFDQTCQNTPAVKEVKERARRYSNYTSFGQRAHAQVDISEMSRHRDPQNLHTKV